jgi:hypothetical protein
MQKTLILAICFGFLNEQSTFARLSETQDQAEARYGLPKSEKAAKYGRPLIEGAKELTFEYEGWRIRCALLKGKPQAKPRLTFGV